MPRQVLRRGSQPNLATKEQPEHGGQLDVTHAHPARVREREHEQKPARGRARDQLFGYARGLQREPDPDCRDGRRKRDPVRDDPAIEVDQGDRHERRDERESKHDVVGRALRQHDGDGEDRGQRLDERIPGRDADAALAAMAVEQQPTQNGNVVVRLDGRIQLGQWDPGETSDSPRGRRYATTFKERPGD